MCLHVFLYEVLFERMWSLSISSCWHAGNSPISLEWRPFGEDNGYCAGTTKKADRSDLEPSINISYLNLIGQLGGICRDYFEEDWPCYVGSAFWWAVWSSGPRSLVSWWCSVHFINHGHSTNSVLPLCCSICISKLFFPLSTPSIAAIVHVPHPLDSRFFQ